MILICCGFFSLGRLYVDWIKRNGYLFRIWICYYPAVHISHHKLLEVRYYSISVLFYQVSITRIILLGLLQMSILSMQPILSNPNLTTKTMEYKFIVSENCLGALAGNVVHSAFFIYINSSLILG
jgi:hypothetical protein